MAFADTIGAIATVANLKEGETTTTIESKTNFFAAVPLGDTARAECTPLHKGRTTMVWQTKITRGDGGLRDRDADADGDQGARPDRVRKKTLDCGSNWHPRPDKRAG